MGHDLAERALDWSRKHPLPNGHIVPICLWGPRGVGKTAWMASYCESRGYGLRGYQPSHDHDGTGLTGLPRINESTGNVEFAPPPFLPSQQLAGTSLQEDEGIIFYDEINRGSVNARNALMEPINEDRISRSGWEAPAGWAATAAANPPEPGYDVEEMDESLMNRMCHIWISFSRDSWRRWAQAGASPLQDGVVSFAYDNSEKLATDRNDLPDTIRVPLTPRSMEFLGRLYVPGMDRDLLAAFAAGLLGKEHSPSFMEHIAEYESREFQPQAVQLTAEHILAGEFYAPLAAELAAGNQQRVQEVATLLGQRMAGHPPHPVQAANIAAFLKQAGGSLARACVGIMHQQAPRWTPVVQTAYKSS